MLGEKSSLLANFIPISQHFSIIKLADSLVLISTCLLCLASFVKHLYIKKSVFFSSSHASGRASEWRRLRRVRDAHRAHSKRQDSSQIRAAGNGAQAKCWRWSRKKNLCWEVKTQSRSSLVDSELARREEIVFNRIPSDSRLDAERKKCEFEISMLCILTYFTTLLQLARKWELAETSSSSFPVAAADLVVQWRVFFCSRSLRFLALKIGFVFTF